MHAHDHTHRLEGDRKLLIGALALIAGLMIGEIVAGIVAGSLALLADAGHLVSDALALGFAVAAATLAARPARGRWTYGLGRLEILAAQANGILLGLVGIWIVYGAIRRLVSPVDVRGGIVLVVALVGIVVNLAATILLSRASRESMNVRGAFLHVATDLLAFAGTAVAGLVVLLTGWDRVDPIAGILVAALMFWAAFGLIRDSTHVFLEASPGTSTPTTSPARSSPPRMSARSTTCTSGR
jgi:cobalt-zinc-cadmium efflux system protein